MKKFVVVLFILSPLNISAQDIEVKKLELLAKDQTAVASPRKNINGTAWGLAKLVLNETGAEFRGY